MDKEMSVKNHMKELRNKFILTIIVAIIVFILAFTFSTPIIEYLLNHFNIQASILSPIEYVNMQVKLSFGLAILCIIPMMLYSTYSFIKPAVEKKYMKYTIKSLFYVNLLALLGILFAYFIFIPYSFNFLNKVPEGVNTMWSLASVINYITFSFIAFAGTFQITALIPLSVKLKIISYKKLAKGRKYIIPLALIVSGILTPSFDAYSQIIMAVPMYACFEVGLLLSKLNKQEVKNGIRIN